jgi:hypothetical protein
MRATLLVTALFVTRRRTASPTIAVALRAGTSIRPRAGRTAGAAAGPSAGCAGTTCACGITSSPGTAAVARPIGAASR